MSHRNTQRQRHRESRLSTLGTSFYLLSSRHNCSKQKSLFSISLFCQHRFYKRTSRLYFHWFLNSSEKSLNIPLSLFVIPFEIRFPHLPVNKFFYIFCTTWYILPRQLKLCNFMLDSSSLNPMSDVFPFTAGSPLFSPQKDLS